MMLVGLMLICGEVVKFAVTDCGAVIVMLVLAEFAFATLPVQLLKVKPAFGVAVSGAVSDEPDYFSWAAGLMLSQDLLEKNLGLDGQPRRFAPVRAAS